MLDAEFLRSFNTLAAFETKIFPKALGHVEDKVLSQLVHRSAVRHPKMYRFDMVAVVGHVSPLHRKIVDK